MVMRSDDATYRAAVISPEMCGAACSDGVFNADTASRARVSIAIYDRV
jgi:hypothetical protein